MKGRVVNKHARWNNMYSDFSQEPDYQAKKGRIINFAEVPNLNAVKTSLSSFIGSAANSLICETNVYYDIAKCGIGWHGDTERKIVVGLRLGAEFPLLFHWFHQGKLVGQELKISLGHGDLYIMSEKAVGYDWKKKIIPTLRHAAGFSETYIGYKKTW